MADKVEASSWGEMVLETAAFVLGGLVIVLMLSTAMLGGTRPTERHAERDKPSRVESVERRGDRPGHDGAKHRTPGQGR